MWSARWLRRRRGGTGACGADQSAAHGAERGANPARGVTHLRECRAPSGHGSGEHAPCPAWPDAARAGQYPVGAARSGAEDTNGDLVCTCTKPWYDGITGITLSPLQLLEKLAALV